MLLLSLNKLARRLAPLRIPCGLIAGAGWLALVWVMVVGGDQPYSLFLRATLAVTLWALVLIAFTSLFRTLPSPPLPALKWHERLMMRMVLVLYYLMTVAFIALLCLVAGISLKLMLLR